MGLGDYTTLFRSIGEEEIVHRCRSNTHKILSFNMTDTSGDLVATLVTPTVDTGVYSKSGEYYNTEAAFTIRWERDQKLAFFTVAGVGTE